METTNHYSITGIDIRNFKRVVSVAPILIKDASTIDKKMLRAIADLAKEYGAQVFAEVIANKEEDGSYDRECSFIIEEGRNALQVVKA